ncbi:Hypothetical predicted protein [Octopus vulgaris]|uniref:Uncharacterized protein n=1 Tax=Octopus vulgaris TaxID=6645 RepID=A0AA36ANP1_OCTVU|nr:Hypothetical predicted protein [Octopus vulgaris]
MINSALFLFSQRLWLNDVPQTIHLSCIYLFHLALSINHIATIIVYILRIQSVANIQLQTLPKDFIIHMILSLQMTRFRKQVPGTTIQD